MMYLRLKNHYRQMTTSESGHGTCQARPSRKIRHQLALAYEQRKTIEHSQGTMKKIFRVLRRRREERRKQLRKVTHAADQYPNSTALMRRNRPNIQHENLLERQRKNRSSIDILMKLVKRLTSDYEDFKSADRKGVSVKDLVLGLRFRELDSPFLYGIFNADGLLGSSNYSRAGSNRLGLAAGRIWSYHHRYRPEFGPGQPNGARDPALGSELGMPRRQRLLLLAAVSIIVAASAAFLAWRASPGKRVDAGPIPLAVPEYPPGGGLCRRFRLRRCHAEIAQHYRRHPMGRSLATSPTHHRRCRSRE